MKNQLNQFAASSRVLLQRLVRPLVSFFTQPDGLRFSLARGEWVTRRRTWCYVWMSHWKTNKWGRWQTVVSYGRDISRLPNNAVSRADK